MSEVDALFVGAHPDDVELTCGGLAATLAERGYRVALCDLTRGEAGSRGNPEERAREATAAAEALGVAERDNLGLPDTGLSRGDRVQLAAVVGLLRRRRPSLVVAPDPRDMHPDHVEAGRLVSRAAYLAGLTRFAAPGEPFRPDHVLHALYRHSAPPHLVVDVTTVFERRMAALRAHASQLGLDGRSGPDTYLTAPDFLAEVEARARTFGAWIGVRYGEGFRSFGPLPVWSASSLVRRGPQGVVTGRR